MTTVNKQVNIFLKDGTEASGTVEKVRETYLILDDDGAFGDMIAINFSDIEEIIEL